MSETNIDHFVKVKDQPHHSLRAHEDLSGSWAPTRHTWRRPEKHEEMRIKLMEKSNSLAEV